MRYLLTALLFVSTFAQAQDFSIYRDMSSLKTARTDAHTAALQYARTGDPTEALAAIDQLNVVERKFHMVGEPYSDWQLGPGVVYYINPDENSASVFPYIILGAGGSVGSFDSKLYEEDITVYREGCPDRETLHAKFESGVYHHTVLLQQCVAADPELVAVIQKRERKQAFWDWMEKWGPDPHEVQRGMALRGYYYYIPPYAE